MFATMVFPLFCLFLQDNKRKRNKYNVKLRFQDKCILQYQVNIAYYSNDYS